METGVGLCLCLENTPSIPWALKSPPILTRTFPLLGCARQEYCQMDQSVTRVTL